MNSYKPVWKAALLGLLILMLRWYGYLGLALIIFAEINFYLVMQPFATWYIPIVWYGYILFVDSLVYKVRKRSLISSYFKEFVFMLLLSVLFWSVFELYNIFTVSWIYSNYVWYVHLADFTTIMPAVLETFSLIGAFEVGKFFDTNKRKNSHRNRKNEKLYRGVIALLAVIGAILIIVPFFVPYIGFPLMWLGIFFFLDPINYLTGRPSVIKKASTGKKSMMLRLWISGIIMGFFWEFWNYQAYPKWRYNLPSYVPWVTTKLFAMPVFGYLGYLPFAVETFLFFAMFRSFIFKRGNDLLEI